MTKEIFFNAITMFMFILLNQGMVYGQQLYVSQGGSDIENDCLNSSTPCASVQHAVDVADKGDTIHIAAGTYTESVNIDEDITLLGAGSSRTTIQAAEEKEEAQERVLSLDVFFGRSLYVRIEGMTIQNGRSLGRIPMAQGGGILNKGTLWMKDVVLRDNYSEGRGGGLCDMGTSFLEDVHFIDNIAEVKGGGMYGDYGDKTIRYCQYKGNKAGGNGGGMFLYYADTVKMEGTYFYKNRTEKSGGGVFFNTVRYLESLSEVYEKNYAVAANSGGGGGAAYINVPKLRSKNVIFKGNISAEGLGGGLASNSVYDYAFYDFTFIDNEALGERSEGGGFYFSELRDWRIQDETKLIMKRGKMMGNSSALLGGAGIFGQIALCVIDSTKITDNRAALLSGGIHFGTNGTATSTIKIRNCEISRNSDDGPSYKHGAGVVFDNDIYKIEVVNTLFDGNIDGMKSGPAIRFEDIVENEALIQNCTFVNHYFERNFKIGTISVIHKSPESVHIKNCIFYNNNSERNWGANLFNHLGRHTSYTKDFEVSYSNIGTDKESIYPLDYVILGEGLVDVDPLFNGEDDYLLSEESSLINAGDPDTDMSVFPVDENGESVDLSGNPRVLNDTIDMGAYETLKPENRKEKIRNKTVEIEKIVSYPNPAKDYVMLEFPEWAMDTDAQAEVFDESGRKVLAISMNGQHILRIDTDKLMSGTYYIRLWDNGKFANGTFTLVK